MLSGTATDGLSRCAGCGTPTEDLAEGLCVSCWDARVDAAIGRAEPGTRWSLPDLVHHSQQGSGWRYRLLAEAFGDLLALVPGVALELHAGHGYQYRLVLDDHYPFGYDLVLGAEAMCARIRAVIAAIQWARLLDPHPAPTTQSGEITPGP